jgi:hypothetical protein
MIITISSDGGRLAAAARLRVSLRLSFRVTVTVTARAIIFTVGLSS